MSETAPREVGSVSPVRFTGAASGSPSSPGRREVSPEGTTTAPGFPPLAATPAQGPAHSGPRCAGSPALTPRDELRLLSPWHVGWRVALGNLELLAIAGIARILRHRA